MLASHAFFDSLGVPHIISGFGEVPSFESKQIQLINWSTFLLLYIQYYNQFLIVNALTNKIPSLNVSCKKSYWSCFSVLWVPCLRNSECQPIPFVQKNISITSSVLPFLSIAYKAVKLIVELRFNRWKMTITSNNLFFQLWTRLMDYICTLKLVLLIFKQR